MNATDRVFEIGLEATQWRRDFHANPELLYDVERTAGIVARKLKAFGLDEIVTGIGRAGVVGRLKGKKVGSSRTIGLRADMDALPIREASSLPYKSSVDGKMHACGHDGHTAMLLGAAKLLSEQRDFFGEVVFIFQPAEEGGKGAKAMVNDGLFDRFPVDQIFGFHNKPGLEVGRFETCHGSIMSASDRFVIQIEGQGGHAGIPHEANDPLIAANHLFSALQTIVSRNVDPLDSAVLSVTSMHAGDAFNVMPATVEMKGTFRSLSRATREKCYNRISEICLSLENMFDLKVDLEIFPVNPVTINADEAVDFALGRLQDRFGRSAVTICRPTMTSEDFSYMLQERCGALIWVGNGDSAPLHHPSYNFNDNAIPYGIEAFAALVRGTLGSCHVWTAPFTRGFI